MGERPRTFVEAVVAEDRQNGFESLSRPARSNLAPAGLVEPARLRSRGLGTTRTQRTRALTCPSTRQAEKISAVERHQRLTSRPGTGHSSTHGLSPLNSINPCLFVRLANSNDEEQLVLLHDRHQRQEAYAARCRPSTGSMVNGHTRADASWSPGSKRRWRTPRRTRPKSTTEPPQPLVSQGRHRISNDRWGAPASWSRPPHGLPVGDLESPGMVTPWSGGGTRQANLSHVNPPRGPVLPHVVARWLDAHRAWAATRPRPPSTSRSPRQTAAQSPS